MLTVKHDVWHAVILSSALTTRRRFLFYFEHEFIKISMPCQELWNIIFQLYPLVPCEQQQLEKNIFVTWPLVVIFHATPICGKYRSLLPSLLVGNLPCCRGHFPQYLVIPPGRWLGWAQLCRAQHTKSMACKCSCMLEISRSMWQLIICSLCWWQN